MFTDCLCYQKQIYNYIDNMLDAEAAARLEEHIKGCAHCEALLQEARAMEAGLHEVFAPMEPPQGFSGRVMAALPLRETVFAAPAAKSFRFPRRVVFTGLGTLATAMALVIGVSSMGGNINLPAVDIAENPPAVVQPTEPEQDVTNNQPQNTNQETDASHNTTNTPANTTTPPQNGQVTDANNSGTVVPETPNAGDGSSLLPQASFGTEEVGSLHIRLAAAYDQGDLYGMHLAGKNELGFYTYTNKELALWQIPLLNAGEPECLSHFTVSNDEELAGLLQNACPTYPVNTVLFSPDNSLQASNVRGENAGLWVSGALLDKPYLLSADAGGNLLAWSPNGSKLLFTDTSGSLYVGYPLEEQVLKIYDGTVTDVLWCADNQTIAFLAKANGNTYNSLFTAKLP